MFDFLKNISPVEFFVILAIVLLLFGGKVLMGMARSSGKTVKELKKVKKEFNDALEDDDDKSSQK